MILKNGLVMDENFKLVRADVRIHGEEIAEIGEIGEDLDGCQVIDMRGKYILPGFIDTHIHGAFGSRISDKHPDLEAITRFEATQGVTALALTTATSEFSELLKQLKVAKEAAGSCRGAKIAGIHAEGPFISRKYKGAMNPEYILEPDTSKLDQMIAAAGGLLKLLTVAPENEGCLALIRHAKEKEITVSMGHTNASYEEAQSAIAAGASQLTHTFNAMRGWNHREPGVLGAAFTNDQVICEMICDYVHLHPAAVETIYRVKGADRINIISDSGHAAGLNVAEFEVDGIVRYVKDGVVRLADGTIAGSAKTVADGVKNLLRSKIPIEDVSRMASLNPATSLKMADRTGSIARGKLADLVVLDEEWNVEHTFVNGTCVYQSPALLQ